MKHSVPHDLGQEMAQKAADAALKSYREKFSKYEPQANWSSPTKAEIGFRVKGVTLKGMLEVRPSSIDMELEVPFLLRVFQGQAVKLIEGEIKEWIGKAKQGQL